MLFRAFTCASLSFARVRDHGSTVALQDVEHHILGRWCCTAASREARRSEHSRCFTEQPGGQIMHEVSLERLRYRHCQALKAELARRQKAGMVFPNTLILTTICPCVIIDPQSLRSMELQINSPFRHDCFLNLMRDKTYNTNHLQAEASPTTTIPATESQLREDKCSYICRVHFDVRDFKYISRTNSATSSYDWPGWTRNEINF